ncbi:MAG: Nucleoside diphosphate kinase [Tardiphaga sp.]|jgi:hypothetical protein|nr:Nucleoside diphosphate kinase [Tardiphaga sp.]
MHARVNPNGHDALDIEDDILGAPVACDGSALAWRVLTRMPVKAELYARDTHFREALADARAALGENMIATLHRSALVMLKPDGLVGGRARAIVTFMQAHGFAIAAVVDHTLTRLQWREFWRFQVTAATLDRLAVYDLILQDRALLLLLRDETPEQVPASARLSAMKGPADISLQPQDCLRRQLDQPNRLFSFFHVADEPADLLRELAILCDAPVRRALLSRLEGGALPRQERQLLDDTLSIADRTARTFDVQASLQRLMQALRGRSDEAAGRVRVDVARMQRGETIAWRAFAAAMAAAGLEVERWDLALLGATFTVPDEPGASKTIGSVSIDAWR